MMGHAQSYIPLAIALARFRKSPFSRVGNGDSNLECTDLHSRRRRIYTTYRRRSCLPNAKSGAWTQSVDIQRGADTYCRKAQFEGLCSCKRCFVVVQRTEDVPEHAVAPEALSQVVFSERNWSHWGRMYRKVRSQLAITRAEKLVAVSAAAKIANKDKSSCEEKEMELLCT
ncbi:TPA: hypothetical protein ACH3X1_014604 [Trebouxia sp. C0004]